MTRWARSFKKKHVDASSWDELKGSSSAINRKSTGGNSFTQGNDKISEKRSKGNDLKKEKQREARRKRRNKKKICFNCRKGGHSVADCPLTKKEDNSTGICFKCGSTEHAIKDCKAKVPKDVFPFAKCFVCGEDGHISRNCPDNPRGLYPLGGGCAFCDSVEHYKRDCPENPTNQKDIGKSKLKGATKRRKHDMSSADAEHFSEEEREETGYQEREKKPKVVKF